ncbi:related to Mitochondrial escape protein 2 [Cephalotrichum gorgonifer]|uniref:Mitochondrial escape protein 2 n=1 Tax=Cephalotrichum gorgonifer TaxID=2041049 RepID=A0AAE8N1X4_9PEZI|nr:related to Mitochondrial escape protein 2 [Cephalotrichum gorgonifer]
MLCPPLGRAVPRATLAQRPTPFRYSARWATTPATTVEEDSIPVGKDQGHISKKQNETIAFFDNLFPLKLTRLLSQSWKNQTELAAQLESPRLGIANPVHLIKRATAGLPMTITEIIPRVKDGGAFVKFTYKGEVTPEEVEAKLSAALEEKSLKPWFNPFAKMDAGIVRGIPWLEDLNRFPTSRIRIEFLPREPGESAVELYQETLYSLFRQYGKIAEISSQPPDSKVVPRFAYVDFVFVRNAVMARNCLHGFVVGEALGGGKEGTRLRISYERKIKPHSIWNWITSHPRLVIPVVAALLAAVTVAVFDPIRKFFVKSYVKHRLSLASNSVYGWIKSHTGTLLSGYKRKDRLGLAALWNQRQGLVEEIQSNLADPTGTFLVVQGPRGSGREELVEQALKDRKYVLTVDCKAVTEANGETGAISKLAAAVGYRPVFSWANNISSMVDLAVQSTTGVKAGFSETFEAQVSKILRTAASALKEVSLTERPRGDSGTEEGYLGDHPGERVVVVIDNFLCKSEDNKSSSSVLQEKVAEWAAALVQNNAAHVIFVTSEPSFAKPLERVLPDRAPTHISLGDVPLDVAREFILSKLEEDSGRDEKKGKNKEKKEKQGEKRRPDLTELDTYIETIGGRLSDLEILATRLKTGQEPSQAVTEIINQSAAEIVKNFVLRSDPEGRFSTEQAWWLIKNIAERKTLSYDEALLHPALSAGPGPAGAALEALASAELISIVTRRGVPVEVGAGKPIYRSAFALLASDTALRRRMDRAVLASLAGIEKKKIEGFERELAVLGGLPREGKGAEGRVGYLLEKMMESQGKIVGFEGEMEKLKGKGKGKRSGGGKRWWEVWR